MLQLEQLLESSLLRFQISCPCTLWPSSLSAHRNVTTAKLVEKSLSILLPSPPWLTQLTISLPSAHSPTHCRKLARLLRHYHILRASSCEARPTVNLDDLGLAQTIASTGLPVAVGSRLTFGPYALQ